MATKTLGTGGGRDFATIAAAQSYYAALAFTEPEVLEVYNDALLTTSATIDFIGWTGGSSTNTLTMRPATGQGFRNHAGVQTNALRYNQANGAAWEFTGGYVSDGVLKLRGGNIIVDGLQIRSTQPSSKTVRIGTNSGTTIKNSIVEGAANNEPVVEFNAANGELENCLLINKGGGGAGGGLSVTSANATITGCTIARIGAAAGRGAANQYGGTILMRNTVLIGFSTDTFGTFSASCANNATSKSAFDVSNAGASGAVLNVTSAAFVSMTSGSEDFRIPTGSVLKDVGGAVGLGVDIVGTTRPQGAGYDIGVWEFQAPQITATLAGTLDTITGAITAGAADVSATLAGTLDSITGNLAAGGNTGRLTSTLPLRDAARLVLANRNDLVVHVLGKPGLGSVILLNPQSTNSGGLWTAPGPFIPGNRYNVMYELAGEPIGCEIITAGAV